jgi:hypothetical protein
MSKATEAMNATNLTHGQARKGNHTKEYRSWAAMIARCYNTKNKEYFRYGGRGILVCGEWRSSFVKFFADLGPAPSPNHTLDRINPDLGYSPDNCRWATPLEQGRNKRTTHRYEGKSLSEWAEWHGINYFTLMDRWRRGDRGTRLFRPVVLR